MAKVKVGMIVNYKTTQQDQARMSEHRSVCNVRAELPAVVTAVISDDMVNLKVFHDGQGEIWATSSPKGNKEGCWNFYPEEKAGKKGKDETADAGDAGEGENTGDGAEKVS